MLTVIILVVCIGLSSQQLPHGHDLELMVEEGFRRSDTNNDGVLSLAEVNAYIAAEDLNGDGQLTIQEYMTVTHLSEAAIRPIFNAYDLDGNGMIPTDHMDEFLHHMDTNGDGRVTLNEYEPYQLKLYRCVYSDHGYGLFGHARPCVQQR